MHYLQDQCFLLILSYMNEMISLYGEHDHCNFLFVIHAGLRREMSNFIALIRFSLRNTILKYKSMVNAYPHIALKYRDPCHNQ